MTREFVYVDERMTGAEVFITCMYIYIYRYICMYIFSQIYL